MTHLTGQQFSARLDGALIGLAMQQATRHLQECEACGHEMDVLAAQDRALAHALLDAPGGMWFDAIQVEVETAIDPARAGRNAVRLATLEAEHEHERERQRVEQIEARARALEAQRAEREREDTDARARKELEATEREEKGIREAAALFERARNQSNERTDDLSEFTTAAMESTAAAEARLRAEATLRAEAEARAQAQAEAETHAQVETEALERAQAEAQTRADAEARAAAAATALAEAEARAAAAMRARVEAEERAALAARQIAEAEARLLEIRAAQAKALAQAAEPAIAPLPPSAIAPPPPSAVAPPPSAVTPPAPSAIALPPPSAVASAAAAPPGLDPADTHGLPPTLHTRVLPAAGAPTPARGPKPATGPAPSAPRIAPGAPTMEPIAPLSRARAERFVVIHPPKPQRNAGAAWLAAAAALLTIVCAVLVLLHVGHRPAEPGPDAAAVAPAPTPHARATLDSGRAAPAVRTPVAPETSEAQRPTSAGDSRVPAVADPTNASGITSGASADESAPRSSATPAARALLSAGSSSPRASSSKTVPSTSANRAAADAAPARRVVVEPREAPGAPVKQAPDPPPGAGLALLCGVVRSASGEPIAGARVILHELGVGVVTDRQGRFCITAAAGDRLVRVAAPGYVAWGEVVSLGARTAELEISLKPDSTHAR